MTSVRPLSHLDATLPLDQRLALLMDAWPDLHLYGLREARTSEADFACWRLGLANAPDVVGACIGILADAPRARRRMVGSYLLKHVLEDIRGDYIPNGAAIAACLLLGFAVKPCAPNVLVNVPPKWLKAVSPRRLYL